MSEHLCKDCESCGCECSEPCVSPWPCPCGDLADHLTDLADEYASPAPVVVVNLPDNDWREAKG